MTVDDLQAAFDDADIATDADGWALAAYRLAVATVETATGSASVATAIDLLSKAGRILTPARAPLEHGRILTAIGNCQRMIGRPDLAHATFELATQLLAGRAPINEQAAALGNHGLALTEARRPHDGLTSLDRACDLLWPNDGELDLESDRVRAALLINRAQAHQAIGDDAHLALAIDDYFEAGRAALPDSPQRGHALHGQGAATLEAVRRGGSKRTADEAIDAFEEALRVLTLQSFPFQHAIARHSLAVAYEQRADPLDLQRAVAALDAALSVFDPRLHADAWRTAMSTLDRLLSQLGRTNRVDPRTAHFVDLLAATDANERDTLLRERLGRLSHLPVVRIQADLQAIADAAVQLHTEGYDSIVRAMIPVLMELPDPVLDAACRALATAHQQSGSVTRFDAVLDTAIHDLLHGPQRVRVRDLLETSGWIRP